jgi:hypothetical protein
LPAPEGPATIVDELRDRLEGVDEDDSRAVLLDQPLHQLPESLWVRRELLRDTLVDDRRADQGGIGKGELLQVGDDLGKGFREGRQVEDRTLVPDIGEGELLGEDRLAAAGSAHEDVDGVGRKAAVQDGVDRVIAGTHAFHCRALPCCGRPATAQPTG